MDGHELAMSLRAAYLAMHRRTDAALARWSVTADQFVVLSALEGEDAPTQRELTARTSSDPNTLRAMLILLERRGLIERRPHPTDRRARRVGLTEEGRRILRELWEGGEEVRRRMVDAVTPAKAAVLTELLRRLTAALEPE